MAINPNDPYGALEKNNKASGIKTPPPLYGGFWVRLGALFLDAIILFPIFASIYWGGRQFRLFEVCLAPLVGIIYSIYLVKRFGGTPGKLILGLRIRKVDGSPVGYKEAVLRYLPEFIFGLFGSVALIMVLLQISDADYASLSLKQRSAYIKAHKPAWDMYAHIAGQIWIWSEFIVLLTNKKRRALHDFIAGTVVMRKSALPPALPATTVPEKSYEH